MARPPRDPRARLDRPGERPLLQGHLRRGGQPARLPTDATEVEGTVAAPTVAEDRSVQPATEGAEGAADAKRGKATRSPAEVAKRRNLEGSEQGPK
jgi:hypothetical protein